MKITQQKPVMDEAEACIGRIHKLIVFLDQRRHSDGTFSTYASEIGRDEANLRIHPDTFSVVLHSCQISGHNGDSYDRKERVLTGEERLEKLKRAENRLFEEARAKYVREEEKRKEEEKVHRLDNAVRKAVFGNDQ